MIFSINSLLIKLNPQLIPVELSITTISHPVIDNVTELEVVAVKTQIPIVFNEMDITFSFLFYLRVSSLE